LALAGLFEIFGTALPAGCFFRAFWRQWRKGGVVNQQPDQDHKPAGHNTKKRSPQHNLIDVVDPYDARAKQAQKKQSHAGQHQQDTRHAELGALALAFGIKPTPIDQIPAPTVHQRLCAGARGASEPPTCRPSSRPV
jgi:hypothetical protein